MYDSIGSNALWVRQYIWKPGNLIGYYIAGNSFIWTDAEKRLFPPDSLVSITLTASFLGADVLDVEPGGASPSQCHDWIAGKKAQGYYRPTIYCSLANVPAVRAGTGAFILGKDYDLWVAKWDGNSTLPYPSAIAKQETDAGPYDVSVVYDPAWPHRKATVTPPPPPPPPPPVLKPVTVTHTYQVPQNADHLVVNAFAIVDGKAVALPTIRPAALALSNSYR